jgi:hypothetical protein
MKERDHVQLRIDQLSNPVRAYLALGFALNSEALDEQGKVELRTKRFQLLDRFTPLQKAELTSFGEFMTKEVKRK